MNEYLLLMHADAPNRQDAESGKLWEKYLRMLQASGKFDGGSSMGDGALYKKGLSPAPTNGIVTGFLRVRAGSLDEATQFLLANPVFEAGGTVEIRELTRD